MIKFKRFRLFLYLALAAILVLSACSFSNDGDEQSSISQGSEDSSNTEESAPMRCEVMDYPCTFAEASVKTVERGLDLMDVADQVFNEEGNTIAVAEMLLEEDDIEEIYYDERGVWYRVEGAPPLLFLHPEAFTFGLDPEDPENGSTLGGNVLLSPPLNGDGPIGENPPGEKAEKKALFVNPIVWQFGSSVYDTTRSKLLETFDYQCDGCVNYVRGDQHAKDLISEEVQFAGPSYEQFLGWNDYDLIHVFAHGYQFCPGRSVTSSGQPVVSGDRETFPVNTAGVIEGANVEEGECVTMVQTGHYQTKEYLLDNPRDVPGIIWSHKPGAEVWSEAVTTDFFRDSYPGGLDDTILFFTSCQIMKDHSMADALKGTNTAIYGWTHTVKGNRGKATVKQFFTELIENGLTASVAYEKTIESESHTEHSGNWHGAELEMVVDASSDPRGREVVILMQPVYRKFLEERDAIPADGIAGDGEDDDLFIMIQVDGVTEDQNPEDFEVHLSLDGEELPETIKPSHKVGDYSYQAFEILDLSFDVSDQEFVELEAWIDLPEGGDTRHYLEEIELAGCGWTGNMYGSRSGKVEGDIVFPKSNLTKANLDELALLANQGFLGPDASSSGLPSPSDFANLPDYTIFGSRSQFPFMLLIPGQGGTVMMESAMLGIGEEAAISLDEDNQERVEGSFSTSVTDLISQSGYSINGELIWHVDSFCSLDVILELATNPLPEGLME